MSEPQPMITVAGVTYRYRRAAEDALRDVTLTVPEGSCFGLLGPNGAGKSTLLSLLTGVLRLQRGDIEVRNLPLRTAAAAIRHISALAPQDLAVYPALTGRENLSFFAGAFRLATANWRTRLSECVEICQLGEFLDRRVESYSGGMKRRLNLAVALLNTPRVLYLDEPTVGIDALSRQCILDAIQHLHRSGGTIVYTSHYMEEVESLCDELAVIDRGRIVARGPTAALLAAAGGRTVRATLAAPLSADCRKRVMAVATLAERDTDPLNLVFTLQEGDTLGRVVSEIEACGARIARLEYGVRRLERVYLDLLRSNEAPR